jgi:hypothetical protein
MLHPNSINDMRIETFPMIGGQMEIADLESSGNDELSRAIGANELLTNFCILCCIYLQPISA